MNKKLLDLCEFFDTNKKLYVNGNTGKGKTLDASVLGLIFLETHINFKIIANYHLNIYDIKTNENLCEYSKFGLLPFSRLELGNYLIIIDDFKAVKNFLQNFGNILAVLSRKENIYVIITLHYYTHLEKETRELFNCEIMPMITHLRYNFDKHQIELTDKSSLIMDFLNPSSLDLMRTEKFHNILQFVKGNYSLENVYVKEKLYDTYENVKFTNPTNILQEISKFSKSKKDVYQNVNLITKNKSTYKKMVNDVFLLKGWNTRLK